MRLPTVAIVCCLLSVERAGGQGTSGAAVAGSVARANGAPAQGAMVLLVNAATGIRRELRAGAAGRFVFENVAPGGPYRIEAQAIGFARANGPADFMLGLGERVSVRLVFSDAARTLDPVLVEARPRSEDRGGAGGPAYALSSDFVHGLPVLNRDFVGLFATIPQALGRTASSIGGQPPSLNAIQIDGGTAGDEYGVGGATPGSAAGAKSISLEALDEIKVLIAPFDVRHSMFSGGLINAITKSGTNEWRGALFASVQRPGLVGPDTSGAHVDDFEFLQYGATISGPIVRDRLHLFVAADLQRSRTPFVGQLASDTLTGISEATASRASAAFRTRYGFDAGTSAAPVLANPDRSIFTKLTWTVSTRHSVELWHQESRAHQDQFTRSAEGKSGWELSGSGAATESSVGTSRLRIASTVGSAANELIAGGMSSTVGRVSRVSAPLFLVQGDVSGRYLAGGSDRNGQSNTLGQRTYELTDNLSFHAGAHELTFGAHAEWFRVADQNFSGSWGTWTFSSVAALEAGAATRYEIALPLRPGGPIAQFRAREYAAYAQDRWEVSPRISATAGVRIDVPYNAAPATNPLLAADAALGRVNTADFPSGNSIVAPRLALSWLIDESSNTRLRLGAGVFTARPPYVWFGNAFMNTGLDQATLICTAQDGGVPAPVIDPALAPKHCLNTGPGAPPPSAVTYFSSDFRFPSTRKFLVGIDRELGASWSGSIDLIHTRGIDSPYLTDANLRQLGADSEGRAMYGTISPISSTSTGRPTRLDSTAFREAFHYSNRSGDWSTAASIDLAGHWRNGSRLQLGYQWSRARDVISVSNPGVSLTFQNAAIDGTIDDRRLSTSSFDAPHSFTAAGVVPMRGGVTIAVAARAQSGQPFSYVASGDANADGVVSNDLVYVPRSAADVSLTNPELYPKLDAYVESEPCLRGQRGRLAARNSCRNPWFTSLDTRLTKTLALPRSSPIDFSIDVFNLPNLLHGSWGLVRQTATRQLPLLQVAGWDTVANRPRYAIPSVSGTAVLPARNRVLLNESRWRIQLGARLRFGESVRGATAPTSGATRQ